MLKNAMVNFHKEVSIYALFQMITGINPSSAI